MIGRAGDVILSEAKDLLLMAPIITNGSVQSRFFVVPPQNDKNYGVSRRGLDAPLLRTAEPQAELPKPAPKGPKHPLVVEVSNL